MSIAPIGDPPGWMLTNPHPGWPWHWDIGPIEPKVFEVALVGFEDYYVIGVFMFKWDARSAAARALLAYRRHWRSPDFEDYPHRPRGLDLEARITSRKVDEYVTPSWEKD